MLNIFITLWTKEVISEEKSLLILLTLFRVLKVGTVSKKDLMRLNEHKQAAEILCRQM